MLRTSQQQQKKNMLLKKMIVVFLASLLLVLNTVAESPSRFFEWNVTYGTISPLGVPQQVSFFNFRVIFDYM